MTLVSVITPTWQRHELLMERCIQSVFAQTYDTIEHVIISDGPDQELAMIVANDLWRRPRKTRPLVFAQLPNHLDEPIDYGSRARNRGLDLATGDYIAYLDDDNAYRPDHIERLAEALDDNPTVDFVYSMLLTTTGNLIGSPPPQYGHLDTSILMHRAGLPQQLGMWPLPDELAGDKHAPDWGVVERWLNGGATWVHVPFLTVDYWS
jgi:glycosyltransferase involved in cell wall biosynthesis